MGRRKAPLDPLAYDCGRCRAKKGQPCRNYKGQAKNPCPQRGKDRPQERPLVQQDLFSVANVPTHEPDQEVRADHD